MIFELIQNPQVELTQCLRSAQPNEQEAIVNSKVELTNNLDEARKGRKDGV